MAETCRAEWCVGVPVEGSRYCAIHAKAPPLHNLETKAAWDKRINGARRAQKRAAEKAAESDATLAKRGNRC